MLGIGAYLHGGDFGDLGYGLHGVLLSSLLSVTWLAIWPATQYRGNFFLFFFGFWSGGMKGGRA
jgi:hypothetical protein